MAAPVLFRPILASSTCHPSTKTTMARTGTSDLAEAMVLQFWRGGDDGSTPGANRIVELMAESGHIISAGLVRSIINEARVYSNESMAEAIREQTSLTVGGCLDTIQRVGRVMEIAAVTGHWPEGLDDESKPIGDMVRVRAAKEAVQAAVVQLGYCKEPESIGSDARTIIKRIHDVLGVTQEQLDARMNAAAANEGDPVH